MKTIFIDVIITLAFMLGVIITALATAALILGIIFLVTKYPMIVISSLFTVGILILFIGIYLNVKEKERR